MSDELIRALEALRGQFSQHIGVGLRDDFFCWRAFGVLEDDRVHRGEQMFLVPPRVRPEQFDRFLTAPLIVNELMLDDAWNVRSVISGSETDLTKYARLFFVHGCEANTLFRELPLTMRRDLRLIHDVEREVPYLPALFPDNPDDDSFGSRAFSWLGALHATRGHWTRSSWGQGLLPWTGFREVREEVTDREEIAQYHHSKIPDLFAAATRIIEQVIQVLCSNANPCYVTLLQVTPLVGRGKRTLERWKQQGLLPMPDISGGGGKADEWKWTSLRPKLEELAERDLPERFPGSVSAS